MKKIISISFLLLSLFTTSVFASAWQSIGTRTVTRHAEMDTIGVNRGKQVYRKLQLSVRGTALDIDRMVVHFKSGAPQKINLRSNIPVNSKSRIIDIKGNARAIDKVVFWYNSKGLGRKNAVVTLLGR